MSKFNEYSMKVAGGPVTIYKCKRWETRQIVSDEELAAYEHLLATHPAMVSEDYQTHEEVCVEYSDEVLTKYFPLPDWIDKLEPDSVPLSRLFSKE